MPRIRTEKNNAHNELRRLRKLCPIPLSIRDESLREEMVVAIDDHWENPEGCSRTISVEEREQSALERLEDDGRVDDDADPRPLDEIIH